MPVSYWLTTLPIKSRNFKHSSRARVQTDFQRVLDLVRWLLPSSFSRRLLDSGEVDGKRYHGRPLSELEDTILKTIGYLLEFAIPREST